MEDVAKGALEQEHHCTWAVVCVKGGDGEVAFGVLDEHWRAQLHLHEHVRSKLRKDVADNEDREARGVDGSATAGGGDAGEVVTVGVGEEAVALEGRGRGPRVHRDRQPSRQLDWHGVFSFEWSEAI